MDAPDEGQGKPLIEIDVISHTLLASPAKLDDLPNYTSQDIVLSHLKNVIHQGWPEYPGECPVNLREFWNFREDLIIENGHIFKGTSSQLCVQTACVRKYFRLFPKVTWGLRNVT